MEYEDRGTGKAVVMLHGWKDDLHTFDGMTRALSNSLRVIRVDLPGFGGSEPPPADWTLDDYVLFVKNFLTKLSIQPESIVGHSFGGRIAIKGAAAHILNAKKIVLISSAGVARRKTLRNAVLTILAKIGRVLTAIPPISVWKQDIRKKLYGAIGSDYFRAGALRGTFLNIINEDLSEAAKGIAVPTLIIWGGDDDTTPVREGERLNQLIAGSTFRVIGGAGHFVHKEKPDEVSAIMRQFIV